MSRASDALLRPMAIWRGAFAGLVGIVPITIAVEVIDRQVHDLDRSNWLVLPFLLILFMFVLAGFGAAQWALDAPFSNGSLAALAAFGGWLVVRTAVALALGDDLGFGPRAVFAVALFAVAFGMAGAAVATRGARRGS